LILQPLEYPLLSKPDDYPDRPAKWYFGLKNAMLEMKKTGGEFRHPMNGPVTLTWRS
jgi:hypothetical protein